MIDQKAINKLITKGLKEITGCEVVKANLAGAPIPDYPYISFTILNTNTRKGTYSDGTAGKYIPARQTWSFSVQGSDDDETFRIGLLSKDWFEESGRRRLNDYGVVVESVGAITNRDTLLTVNYEYRKGFDVVLSLMNVIQVSEIEVIDQVDFEKE